MAKNRGKQPPVHRKLTNFRYKPIAKYTNLVYNIIRKINKPYIGWKKE
jgi:hypothetical protein